MEISFASSTQLMYCKVCTRHKPRKEFLSTKDCSHSFCAECMVKHIACKTQEGISSIKCPEPSCMAVLDPYQFAHNSVVPKHVFVAWCSALCLAMIDESKRFYCPFKDCSGLMVDEGDVVVTQSECPYCHRLFCAQCRVSWHSGIMCNGFQNVRWNEEAMVLELAKERKWQKCPNCKFYVERTEGCPFMRCSKGKEKVPSLKTNKALSRARSKEVSWPRVMEKACALKSNNDLESMYCKICAEHKPQKESLSTKGCSHSFCSDCIVKYIAYKTQNAKRHFINQMS
ncbi:hypothetical protein Sjap_012006 [Stephania japonica]|uniref:RBR-type E3 ubiquitin transferase n=1 Tax=Stephania japonica TaxID=461633 RepID=A0AAP0JCG7_9MAGN